MSARVVRDFVSPKALADAELDHRVALADARDEYRAAVVSARRALEAATRRADVALATAQARQRSAEVARERLAEYYRVRPQALLEEDLERFQLMNGPDFGVLRERGLKEQVEKHIELISAEIARRGAEDR